MPQKVRKSMKIKLPDYDEPQEVALPYYYTHDLDFDDVFITIYGKLTNNKQVYIEITATKATDEFNIVFQDINWDYCSRYLRPKHKSDAATFENVRQEALEALNTIGKEEIMDQEQKCCPSDKDGDQCCKNNDNVEKCEDQKENSDS